MIYIATEFEYKELSSFILMDSIVSEQLRSAADKTTQDHQDRFFNSILSILPTCKVRKDSASLATFCLFERCTQLWKDSK